MIFCGMYGPPFPWSRTHVMLYGPQSLNGTPSRPTVQSRRGSTGVVLFTEVNAVPWLFHVDGDVTASGRPVTASVLKKFTRLIDGGSNPQHWKWLGAYGKFSRSPQLEFAAFGSPSCDDAW